MPIDIIEIARYPYAGYHHADKNSACRVQIGRVDSPNGLRYALVVFTELSDNPGTSVTNRSDFLATEIAREYELIPEGTVFLEHYPASAERKALHLSEYSIVTYRWENGVATQAQWKYISLAEAQALGLQYEIDL